LYLFLSLFRTLGFVSLPTNMKIGVAIWSTDFCFFRFEQSYFNMKVEKATNMRHKKTRTAKR
jgi:hypothetical protein